MREIKHYWEINNIHYILQLKYDEIKDSANAKIINVLDESQNKLVVKELNDMEIRNLISLYKQAKFGGN